MLRHFAAVIYTETSDDTNLYVWHQFVQLDYHIHSILSSAMHIMLKINCFLSCPISTLPHFQVIKLGNILFQLALRKLEQLVGSNTSSSVPIINKYLFSYAIDQFRHGEIDEDFTNYYAH